MGGNQAQSGGFLCWSGLQQPGLWRLRQPESQLPCVYFRAGGAGMEIAGAPLGKGPVLQEAGQADM